MIFLLTLTSMKIIPTNTKIILKNIRKKHKINILKIKKSLKQLIMMNHTGIIQVVKINLKTQINKLIHYKVNKRQKLEILTNF